MLQDVPAVSSGPAAQVEELVYLWKQEGGQLTARGQGQERWQPKRRVWLYLKVLDGRNHISSSGS